MMNSQTYKILIRTLLGLGLGLFVGCGGSGVVSTPEVTNVFEEAEFGTDATLEVVTWNLESFAKSGKTTESYVIQAIEALDVDIVALQEIASLDSFNKVVKGLDGWSGYRASNASADINLAFIYRTGGALQVQSIYPILGGMDYPDPFPRDPLVMELTFNGTDYVVINNHYKAMGDALSEARRREASALLHQYVADHYTDRRVIIVGDLNDELGDSADDNVFLPFIDDPDNWRFADMEIALDISAQWSFPTWPSHLDHVLLTNETFGDLEAQGAAIKVIPLHSYFPGGMGDYDRNISDHLPVGVRLVPTAVANPFAEARFGTQATLDAGTWSLNGLGPDSNDRLPTLALAVAALGLDLLAVQDLTEGALDSLVGHLSGWEGHRAETAADNPGWLVRTDPSTQVDAVFEILTDRAREFPRAPLALEGRFGGQAFVAVNVHLIPGGDGLLDPDNPDDPETIRRDALQLLDSYLKAQYPSARVILLGNFNDELGDALTHNVFIDMMLDEDNWRVADLDIASESATGWTMPAVPSHPDHLILSNELSGSLSGNGSAVQVPALQTYLAGGWTEYENTISDHLPLMVKLAF